MRYKKIFAEVTANKVEMGEGEQSPAFWISSNLYGFTPEQNESKFMQSSKPKELNFGIINLAQTTISVSNDTKYEMDKRQIKNALPENAKLRARKKIWLKFYRNDDVNPK